MNKYFNDHYTSKNRGEAERITRVHFILEERLNKALKLFSGQPRIWVDPIISSRSEISINPDDNEVEHVEIDDIIANPSSIIISAPPQFGLTCLAHYMILEAWKKRAHWLYIDSRKLKTNNVEQYINNDYLDLGIDTNIPIEAVVLDEWSPTENGSIKKLKAVCDAFANTPILLMRTVEGTKFLKGKLEDVKIEREYSFCNYF